MSTLHRKPRSGGATDRVTMDVLPSRINKATAMVATEAANSKSRRAKSAHTHAPPVKQQRMSTPHLRALCAACLLVYLSALCFAEDIVRLGAAVRSDAARQRLFSPWRPVRSAVVAAVATRPLLRVATKEPENDDDAAEDDNGRESAVKRMSVAPTQRQQDATASAVVESESEQRTDEAEERQATVAVSRLPTLDTNEWAAREERGLPGAPEKVAELTEATATVRTTATHAGDDRRDVPSRAAVYTTREPVRDKALVSLEAGERRSPPPSDALELPNEEDPVAADKAATEATRLVPPAEPVLNALGTDATDAAPHTLSRLAVAVAVVATESPASASNRSERQKLRAVTSLSEPTLAAPR